MTIWFPSIDLTRSKLKLSSALFGMVDETWASDAVVWGLSYVGLLDVSWEANEPTDTRKLWFDRGVVPNGQPGILKWWNPDLEQWVRIRGAEWGIYSRQSVAPRWFYTSLLGGLPRPKAEEVRIGDMWVHDIAPDEKVRQWLKFGAAPAWWQVRGGQFDTTILDRSVQRFWHGAGLPGPSLNARTGDCYRNDTTGRLYQYWAGTGWVDYSA